MKPGNKPQTPVSLIFCFHQVDGDGNLYIYGPLDAVVRNHENQTNRVWLNDSTGTFTLGQAFAGRRALGIALADLDGDDDLDAFFGGQGYHTVWFNTGGMYIDSGQTLGSFCTYSVKMADFNNDGALDLASASYRNVDRTDTYPSQIWFNGIYRVYLPLAVR